MLTMLTRGGTPARTAMRTAHICQRAGVPMERVLLLRRSAQPTALPLRWTHNRNVPRSSTGAGRPSQTGSVLSGARVGGNGLFDAADDGDRSTRRGRIAAAGSTAYRWLFGGALVVAMAGAAGALSVFYLYNPEAQVRARTTQLLRNHPVALRAIGPHMQDVTLRTKGARGLQAHHRWPYLPFLPHPIEMEYVLQGSHGRAFVHVQYWKDGDSWKPIYLHLDTNQGRVVLIDVRARM